MKIYLETYGCTLNQADSDFIKGILEKFGHRIVSNEKNARIIILNTCTVKGATENKILERIKKLGKKKLIIAGCLSINKKKLRKAKPNCVIVHPSSIGEINNAVEDCIKGRITEYKKETNKSNTKTDKENDKGSLAKKITVPILRIPIQEGCTGFCYFCQTKFARPELRSYKKERIIEWIREGVKKGAKEIQITGMDSGAYGLDRKSNLIELLNEIEKIKGDFKIRIGMINPNHAKRMLKDLVKILKGKKFYKFIHLPVQTGSEKVCKEMNRTHSVKDFVWVVNRFRKEIPRITIATDIIVGYPTENEKDFLETKKLIKKIRPDVVNVSKFTPREGTKAKEMKQLDSKIVKKRSREMSEICKLIALEENEKLIGKKYEIYIIEKGKGRNENYKQIVVRNFKGRLGDRNRVNIIDANRGSLFGAI